MGAPRPNPFSSQNRSRTPNATRTSAAEIFAPSAIPVKAAPDISGRTGKRFRELVGRSSHEGCRQCRANPAGVQYRLDMPSRFQVQKAREPVMTT